MHESCSMLLPESSRPCVPADMYVVMSAMNGCEGLSEVWGIKKGRGLEEDHSYDGRIVWRYLRKS